METKARVAWALPPFLFYFQCLSWSRYSTGQETERKDSWGLANHSSLIMHVASTPLHVGYHAAEAQNHGPRALAYVLLRNQVQAGRGVLSSVQDQMEIGYGQVLGRVPDSWGPFDVG